MLAVFPSVSRTRSTPVVCDSACLREINVPRYCPGLTGEGEAI